MFSGLLMGVSSGAGQGLYPEDPYGMFVAGKPVKVIRWGPGPEGQQQENTLGRGGYEEVQTLG